MPKIQFSIDAKIVFYNFQIYLKNAVLYIWESRYRYLHVKASASIF